MNAGRVCLVLAVVGVPAAAAAQEPAAGASPGRATPPVWARPDNFWYRVAVPGGHVWLNVDALHGAKTPLFDHQRLATELTLRTGVEYTSLTLPFAEPAAQFVVKYDGSNAYIQEGAMAVEFIHGGNLWRCDLQIKWDWNRVPPTDYECLPRRTAPSQPASALPSADNAAVASPDGRWEAFVHGHNVAIRPAGDAGAAPTVLGADGVAGFAYQPGSIRWSADSQSLSAYRVNDALFASSGVSGNVKRFVARGEWKVPAR